MLTLSLLEAHWLDAEHQLDDQCAHGTVLLAVDQHHLVTPDDGDITVSAAALNLLRTLEHDHKSSNLVTEGDYLFPCCGFNVWLTGQRFPVHILGCSSGVELEVIHTPAGVSLRRAGSESMVSEHEWSCAVASFAESVLAFYKRQPPRNHIEDVHDREGWQAFWAEFSQRLERTRVAS